MCTVCLKVQEINLFFLLRSTQFHIPAPEQNQKKRRFERKKRSEPKAWQPQGSTSQRHRLPHLCFQHWRKDSQKKRFPSACRNRTAQNSPFRLTFKFYRALETVLCKQHTHTLSANIFLLSIQTLFTRSRALLPDRVLIPWSAKSSMPLVQSVFKLTQSHHLSSSPVLLCLFRSRIFALSVTFQSSLYSLPDMEFIGSTVFSESLTREILTCWWDHWKMMMLIAWKAFMN